MANSIQEAKITGFAAFIPAAAEGRLEKYQEIYEQNRHRVYSLAFWMTDNELAAEELLDSTFRRAFAMTEEPDEDMIDRALIAEVRELMTIGSLTLECALATEVADIRRNTKRVHLERAIVQLPATERLVFLMHDGEGYAHDRIARALGLAVDESRYALHQARLRIRELVSKMVW
ncbi:MAG TPA: sigma factor-like helix-turn-helix DNA-binding protein [Clostridia bacterium]|nr:sigma factor-like helix-turn-helix DNA-binding protein [Clostridia bacterium]